MFVFRIHMQSFTEDSKQVPGCADHYCYHVGCLFFVSVGNAAILSRLAYHVTVYTVVQLSSHFNTCVWQPTTI